jgi:hypothetical protein
VFDVPTWLYLQATTRAGFQKQDISNKFCSILAYFSSDCLASVKYCSNRKTIQQYNAMLQYIAVFWQYHAENTRLVGVISGCSFAPRGSQKETTPKHTVQALPGF